MWGLNNAGGVSEEPHTHKHCHKGAILTLHHGYRNLLLLIKVDLRTTPSILGGLLASLALDIAIDAGSSHL